MERKRNFIDKFLDIAPGGLYGILSVIIRMSGDFIAFLFFPEYNMINNMVSDLGVGPGGIFFSLGLIISGIISIPFYVALARSLQSEGVNEKMRKTGLIFFYISDITYIMIGFFPSVEKIYLIYLAHGVFAIISWLTAIIYLVIFSKLMKKDGKFSALPSYSGYLLIIVMIIFLCTWLPIIEWVMTFTFIIWVLLISSYMIYHKL
jgi:hypothetical membrane protein